MAKIDIPDGCRIIECIEIKFNSQDIIELKMWKDFLWLLGGSLTIFKLGKGYYILNTEFVYVYYEK